MGNDTGTGVPSTILASCYFGPCRLFRFRMREQCVIIILFSCTRTGVDYDGGWFGNGQQVQVLVAAQRQTSHTMGNSMLRYPVSDLDRGGLFDGSNDLGKHGTRRNRDIR